MRLKNQPIANETILSYNGKRVLKRWSTLKNFVGKRIRITEEHPPDIDGVFAKGTEVDTALITECPLKRNTLCVDGVNNHGFKGYSLGFKYRIKNKPGVFNGEVYDAEYEVVELDHLALTNSPRDANLVKVGGDSLGKEGIAYDSFEFKSEVNKMTDDKITSLTAELEAIKMERDSLKKQVDEQIRLELDSIEGSLIEKFEYEKDSFVGKDASYLSGLLQGNIDRAAKVTKAGFGISKVGADSVPKPVTKRDLRNIIRVKGQNGEMTWKFPDME